MEYLPFLNYIISVKTRDSTILSTRGIPHPFYFSYKIALTVNVHCQCYFCEYSKISKLQGKIQAYILYNQSAVIEAVRGLLDPFAYKNIKIEES